jgi:hypothetical protein
MKSVALAQLDQKQLQIVPSHGEICPSHPEAPIIASVRKPIDLIKPWAIRATG